MLAKYRWFVAFCSCLLLGAPPLVAQDKKLPEAKQILARHVKAIGGQAKIDAIQTQEIKAKMTLLGMGVGGNLRVLYSSDGKFKQTMEIEGVGTESAGFDGTIIWKNSQITGPKLVDGVEAELLKLRAVPVPIALYEKFFETIECSGVEEFDGVDCYVIKSTKANLKPIFDYFEISTGLHRGTKETSPTNQGGSEVTKTYIDYRDAGGIESPYTRAMKMGPRTIELKISEVLNNAQINPKEFDVPAEVKALY